MSISEKLQYVLIIKKTGIKVSLTKTENHLIQAVHDGTFTVCICKFACMIQ